MKLYNFSGTSPGIFPPPKISKNKKNLKIIKAGIF